MNEVTVDAVLETERRRILADLHDGLGASLIGLLRHVQSGQADPTSVEKRVREALMEMRIAIDALRSTDGRLDTMLGDLRYRIAETLRGSGLELLWDMPTLPANDALDPSRLHAVQRILLEAIANALKHSGGEQLRVAASATNSGAIEICIADDGRGFDPKQSTNGIGLSSMQARARGIGATLDIRSQPGAGTVVHLVVLR